MQNYLRQFAAVIGLFAPWLGFLALLSFILFAASEDVRGQEYRAPMSVPLVDLRQSSNGGGM